MTETPNPDQLTSLDFRGSPKSYIATFTNMEGDISRNDAGELSTFFSADKVELCAIVNRVCRKHSVLLDRQWKIQAKGDLAKGLRSAGVLSRVPRKDMRCTCGAPTRKDMRCLWNEGLSLIVGCDECASADMQIKVEEEIVDDPTRVILSNAPYVDHPDNVTRTRQALAYKVSHCMLDSVTRERSYLDHKGQLYILGEDEGKEGDLFLLRTTKGVVGGESLKNNPRRLRQTMKLLQFGVMKKDEDSGAYRFVETEPPFQIAQDIVDRRGQEFPRLRAIVHIPTLTKEGVILHKYGYDPDSELFVDPFKGMYIDFIPESLSDDDRKWAKDTIDDLLYDFPFVDEPSRAGAVAMAVEQIVRKAWLPDYPCPAYVCCAPDPGTGKSLLAEVIQLVIYGRRYTTQYSNNDEEFDKRLLPLLLKGDPFIIFDNVVGEVSSHNLASALTSTIYSGRVLRESRMADAPCLSTIVLTLNDARLNRDLARRCVMIDLDNGRRTTLLDPDGERLYHCNEVHGMDITSYVRGNRGPLLRALLIMAKAWADDGQPPVPGMKSLDSYEEWCRVIGGIVTHAGYDGFAKVIHRAGKERNVDRRWAETLIGAVFRVNGLNVMNIADLGFVVLAAGLQEKLGFKTGSTRFLDTTTVGRRLVDQLLSTIRVEVEVEAGVKVKLFELEHDEGKRRFQLVVTQGQLSNIINAEDLSDHKMMSDLVETVVDPDLVQA